MNNKRAYLDYIRVFAVFLVLYSHFANVASYVTQELTVFSADYILPINDSATHRAHFIDLFLVRFNTASSAIGVILFFLLAGYLTAMSRPKYSGKVFFIKRIVRLYPMLILSVVICGIIAACMGVKHSVLEYIASGSLLFVFIGYGGTIGTLWTLVIEMSFYCIVLHFKKLNFKNIMIIDGAILFLALSQAKTQLGAYEILYVLRYVPIILFGAMMYEFQETKGLKRYAELVLVAAVTYLILHISFTEVWGEIIYKSLMSYVFALIVWLAFFAIDKLLGKFIKAIDKVIKFFVDTSYLVYLLQLNVGFPTMYFLREAGVGPYINIVCGVIAAFAVSAIVHYLCEKPIQRYLNRKISLWEEKSHA